jgi:threonine/homoserine/homoserine lactone efflux protein
MFGLLLSIMIGPVFFALLQTSIDKGFRAGIQLAVGISLSDAAYILGTYFFITSITAHKEVNSVLGVAGGMIMLVIGSLTVTKKGKKSVVLTERVRSGKQDIVKQVTKGFLLNGINPFVLIFWIGVVSMISLKESYTPHHDLAFFSGMLLTVLSTDIFKAYLANKLSKFITITFLTWLNRISGVVLIAFGLRLLVYAYMEGMQL